jgi:hypothetical protein
MVSVPRQAVPFQQPVQQTPLWHVPVGQVAALQSGPLPAPPPRPPAPPPVPAAPPPPLTQVMRSPTGLQKPFGGESQLVPDGHSPLAPQWTVQAGMSGL